MTIKRKIFLFHFIFFLVLSSGFILPNIFRWALLAFNLLYFFYCYKLKNISSDENKFFHFVLPWFFINGLFFYLSLLPSKIFVWSLLVVGLVLSYYYFRELKRRLIGEVNLTSGNFSVWADVLGLLAIFLITSFSYGLTYFVNVDNWMLLIIVGLVLFFSIWQNISTVEKSPKKVMFFSFLFLFAICPIAWSFFLLPFNYNVFGVLLSIYYYFGLSFIKFYLTSSLTMKKIKYNLIFIIAVSIVIFSTIKWQ